VVRLSPAYVQPIASDDVADAMADVALAAPVNGTIEIAGPERSRLSDLVARYLTATGDSRKVEADPEARYFGARLDDGSLVSDNNPRLGRSASNNGSRHRRASDDRQVTSALASANPIKGIGT
jgi:uncharacterized protein YbjT (DUF2867 family)